MRVNKPEPGNIQAYHTFWTAYVLEITQFVSASVIFVLVFIKLCIRDRSLRKKAIVLGQFFESTLEL